MAGRGEVVLAHAAASDGPLVVLLGQDSVDQADDGVAIGEDADDAGVTADFPLRRSRGLLDRMWIQWALGKLAKAGNRRLRRRV